jgi:RimJ/RimL family protein N-acetyltransferase
MIQPTKRLIFREWLPDDWIQFKPIANDSRVVRYVVHGTVPTDEQIRAHIEAARKRYLEEGFWLAHAYWGNGLATEAAQAVMDYGFGTLGLQRIVAVVHPENRASLRVLQKLGMTFERMAVHQGVEHVLYSKSGAL